MEENVYNNAVNCSWLVERNEYFHIEKQPLEPFHKTNKYEVFNNKTGDWLGEIAWDGAFRKFCFIAEGNIVWDEKCLIHLTNFLIELNKNYREEKKKNV